MHAPCLWKLLRDNRVERVAVVDFRSLALEATACAPSLLICEADAHATKSRQVARALVHAHGTFLLSLYAVMLLTGV